MRKKSLLKWLKKLHKWPAIVISFVAILFASSGIVMNHRAFFSSIDISRNVLPKNYTYENWNLAAIRGNLNHEDTCYVYGNIGVWKSEDRLKTYKDFNQGFPKGIDNRKIYSLIQFKDQLYAGTQMGLYARPLSESGSAWSKIDLPVQKERIADLEVKEDTILVLSRDYLLKSSDGSVFETIQLPEPINHQRKAGFFNTLWELHSGELFGLAGKLLVDLLGLVTIFLAVSGLIHFITPKIIRRKKRLNQAFGNLLRTKQTNLKWHNAIGYIFVVFLLVNTFTGMHLRPPLLIPIANKKIGIIPGTHMDSPNPWFDKLRRLHWDEQNQQYLFSTSDGFFFADTSLSKKLQAASSQPPVSVMGCNVLESLGNNRYMVGSFSGLFLWNTQTGSVKDYFTGNEYYAPTGMAKPFGSKTVAGFVYNNGRAWWFDYEKGAIAIPTNELSQPYGEMPQSVLSASPMSLWNVSLEVHTGRIFENIVGAFYILFVPLAGICLILVLGSGFFLWFMVYRKKKQGHSGK